jgi:uncharacterized protein YndB with AHSA1/START domain
MLHVESETTIARPRDEVFDYLSHAEHLPEYVTDFAWVSQESEGEPARGTRYSYEMKRGQAKGTFDWTEFDPSSRLMRKGNAQALERLKQRLESDVPQQQ